MSSPLSFALCSLLAFVVSACSSTTTCEFASGGTYQCWQDEERDFCEAGGGVFSEDKACADLGYRHRCTAEEKGAGALQDQWTAGEQCDTSVQPGGGSDLLIRNIELPPTMQGAVIDKVVGTNMGFYVQYTSASGIPHIAKYNEILADWAGEYANEALIDFDVLNPDDDGFDGGYIMLLRKGAVGEYTYHVGFFSGTESNAIESNRNNILFGNPSRISHANGGIGATWISGSGNIWQDTHSLSATGPLYQAYHSFEAPLRDPGPIGALNSGKAFVGNGQGIIELASDPAQDQLLWENTSLEHFTDFVVAGGEVYAGTLVGTVFKVESGLALQVATGKITLVSRGASFAVGKTHLFFADGSAVRKSDLSEAEWIAASADLLSSQRLVSHPELTFIYSVGPSEIRGYPVPLLR
jgi:hypothetical protein